MEDATNDEPSADHRSPIRREGPKPYLLLDIDGVPSPFGAGPPPGFTRQAIGEYEVVWCTQRQDWLAKHGPIFELVWATAWEHSANEAMSSVLRLPELPVIDFNRGSGDTWKLLSVQQFIANQPAARIDDDLYLDAFTGARDREAPTLLIRISYSVGITADHIGQLLAFADSVTE